MSWRRHSYSGAGLPPPAPAAVPAAQAPQRPFPGMQPRSLVGSPLATSMVGAVVSPGLVPCAAPSPRVASEPALTAAAVADEEQLQSMLSALRVALAKKDAALVSVAGQLAEAQERLEGAEAERRGLAARVRELEAAGATPDRLAVAASVTAEGRLLAQAREELGREAAAAVDLAAERAALQQDVMLLQQQLMAVAQTEAQERERLAAETAQNRLLARARARQVQQLQAQLAAAASCAGGTATAASQQVEAAREDAAATAQVAAEANARAAAAEAEAVQLRQQLQAVQQAVHDAQSRAAAAEGEAAESAQQAEWQALRIGELEAASSVGQLMRKYEGEVQRLRAQFEADRRELQQQLAQARQQAAAAVAAAPVAPVQAVGLPQEASQDSAAWAALFDQPEFSQPAVAEMQDTCMQTEESGGPSSQPAEEWADHALLDAARLEIERLQHIAAELLDSQAAAQHALEDALAKQREAELAQDSEARARAAAVTELQLALDSARRAEAGLRERLTMAERQLAHQGGEVRALREANDKLDLALTGLQEELDSARQVPHAQLDQLQMGLQRAAAHTDALEAQVQQLKRAAAAAAAEHEAVLLQQAQDGALDTAEQVADAVQAAAQRHGEEVQAAQAQLTAVQQQLQAAQTELAAVQQAQAERQMGMAEAGVQAGSPATAACHAGTQTPAVTGRVLLQEVPPPSATSMLQRGQSPCREGSACETPSFGGCQQSPLAPAPTASVAQTAMQLQLELAKVKLTPMKQLIGGSLTASGASAKQLPLPSRLGSAFGELGSMAYGGGAQHPPPGCDILPGLAAQRQCPGLARSNSSSYSRLAAEDEDAFFATPLAQTPASLSPELSPYSSMLPPAAGAAGRNHSQQQQPQAQPQATQQAQQQPVVHGQAELRWQGPPVPPLDLLLVRPHTSLSCESSGREERSLRCSSTEGDGSGGSCSWGAPSAEASVQPAGSLSSLGPSASQLGNARAPGSGPRGCGSSSSLLRLSQDGIQLGRSPATESGLGSSWQSAALDASLARLAALTAGLTASGSQRQGQW